MLHDWSKGLQFGRVIFRCLHIRHQVANTNLQFSCISHWLNHQSITYRPPPANLKMSAHDSIVILGWVKSLLNNIKFFIFWIENLTTMKGRNHWPWRRLGSGRERLRKVDYSDSRASPWRHSSHIHIPMVGGWLFLKWIFPILTLL